jgi:hypothetical protein
LPVTAAAHLAFFASLGLYLSVVTAGTGRAVFVTVLTFFLACVVPVAAGFALVSPPAAWLGCVWTRDHRTGSAPPAAGLLACAGLYALGAGLFWLATRYSFHRESDRAPARA